MGDMDSGNSGSIQSSSTGGGVGGGDEQEYESRSESIPGFFTPSYPPSELMQLYSSSPFDHHQQQQQQQQQLQQQMFSNFMVNSGNNMDMVWPSKFGSTSIRPSSSTPTDDGNMNININMQRFSNNSNIIPLSTATGGGLPPLPTHQMTTESLNSPRSSSSGPNPNPNQNPSTISSAGGGASATATAAGSASGSGRNPKKRSRASRRAPTTVLTTDTSNFRQMVQEFTGIPAPPFSASGFPTRARFDLFGGLGMSMGMGLLPRASGMTNVGTSSSNNSGAANLDLSGTPYLLRPFPQKMLPHQPPQFLVPHSSSGVASGRGGGSGGLAEAAGANSTSAGASTSTTSTTTSTNDMSQNLYLMPSFIQHGSNMSDHHLRSQATGQHTLVNEFGLTHNIATTTTANAAATTGTTLGGNDDSGLGVGRESDDRPPSWTAAASGMQPGLSSLNDYGGIGGTSAATNAETGTSLLNCTPDNRGGAPTRSEGMVDSWICSSD